MPMTENRQILIWALSSGELKIICQLLFNKNIVL